MGAGSKSKRPRRRAAAADLISDLDDDVLLRVLELLPDTRHAVRTAALSRRWRDLWTRLPALRFQIAPTFFVNSGIGPRFKGSAGAAEARRFLSFVDNAIARRAQTTDAAALEHLAISFEVDLSVVGQRAKKLAPRCIKAYREWIWYAVRSGVKSFVIELGVPLTNNYRRSISREGGNVRKAAGNQQEPVIDLSELPSSAKLETMHLKLGCESLQLPVHFSPQSWRPAVFTSLLDLSLESIVLPAAGAHLLTRLLSSVCCPRLQKLQLSRLWLYEFDELLLVESTTLLELSFEGIHGSGVALELKTPILQFLRIGGYNFIRALRMSSPGLEELTFLEHRPMRIVFDDGELSRVRSLKIHLSSQTPSHISIGLLQCCAWVTCLGVSLTVVEADDDTLRGTIPHLPHLISLTVSVHLPELHCFGVGLADILTQCSNLKYLRVDCSNRRFLLQKADCLCCVHHLDRWKSHEMHLADIQEVEFNGLAGTDCEGWFMQRVLRHAKQLQKPTLSFDRWQL